MRVSEHDCQKDNFERVQTVLREHNIEFDTEKDESGIGVVVVECGLDMDLSLQAARAVLSQVYGVNKGERFRALRFGPCQVWKGAVRGWKDVLPDKRSIGDNDSIQDSDHT